MKLDAGAYTFKMPLTFFPSNDGNEYQYYYKIDIKADNAITYLSSLTESKVSLIDFDKNAIIEKEGDSSKLKKDLVIYFKTIDMDVPLLLYQESEKNKDEVACVLSITPSFLEIQKKIEFETVEG